MKRIQEMDIDSEQSQELKQQQLMVMNRHLKNRRSSRGSKFAPQMQSLYKQALMNVIFGQFQQASKKLKHLITLYPDNPDSFHLLATIHQQIGEQDKAVQYSFMHTYLSPPSLQKWVKVADMSFNLKMYTQAAYCYGRALKIQNYNIQLLTKRAQAFQLSHQTKKAISTYKKILAITKSLPVLKKYAKLRFKHEQYNMARDILTSYQNHQNDPHFAYMISQTYLKEQKYQDLLKYITSYIQNQIKKDPQFNIHVLLIQFIKLVFICLIKLKIQSYDILNTNLKEIKQILLESYEQSCSQLYQELIQYLKSQNQICEQFLKFLLKFRPHKTISNYLLYTQYLKQNKKYQQAIKILQQGIVQHKKSVELTSQLNHIKVISGKWKNNRNVEKNLTGIKNIQKSNQTTFKNQDIFYSDQENNQKQNQQELENENEGNNFNMQNEQKIKKRIKKNQNNQSRSTVKRQIQTEDPEVIRKLLDNCRQTLQSIVNDNLQEKNVILGSFKQVEQCVNFVISLTSCSKQQQKQQKDGLFNRKHRRRRFLSSKKTQRFNSITKNLMIIIEIVSNVIQFMKSLLKTNQFMKAKNLAQIMSKSYFFRWQNKSIELRKLKQIVYQIGLIACIHLQKYQTAVFFIRYLAHRQPQNCLYLLIVNFLIHNSQTKICMNSLLGKFANHQNQNNMKNSVNYNKEEQSQNQNHNSEKIYMQDENQMFEIDQSMDSYPRKMSNISNLSDILKDNVKLNYLFGIQYMETGCFELAITSFIKIINLCEGQIRKNIWLCLTSCFLQISSSRTCHEKLSFTNRSSYCLWQYLNSTSDILQGTFNKARWFAQIRMNNKAIFEFEKILKMDLKTPEQKEIQVKSAYCLLCIYKQIQNWEKVNQVSEKYFSINSSYQ